MHTLPKLEKKITRKNLWRNKGVDEKTAQLHHASTRNSWTMILISKNLKSVKKMLRRQMSRLLWTAKNSIQSHPIKINRTHTMHIQSIYRRRLVEFTLQSDVSSRRSFQLWSFFLQFSSRAVASCHSIRIYDMKWRQSFVYSNDQLNNRSRHERCVPLHLNVCIHMSVDCFFLLSSCSPIVPVLHSI